MVHDDGTIRCLSGDLQHERWKTPTTLATDGVCSKLEHVTLTDKSTACQGLLNGREDAQEALDPEAFILALLSRAAGPGSPEQHIRRLHLLAINPRPRSLQKLLTWALPDSSGTTSNPPRAHLDASSGSLQLILDGHLTTYDLTGTTPRKSSHLRLGSGTLSFLSLSKTLVLTAAPGELTVYDTQYQSVRALLLTSKGRAANSRKKRKRHGTSVDVSIPSPDLVSYLPARGLAIGLDTDKLVGVQLVSPSSGSSLSRQSGTSSLLEAIGRGCESIRETAPLPRANNLPRALHSYLALSDTVNDSRWRDQVSAMDGHAKRRDVENLERVFAHSVQVVRDETVLADWRKQRDEWRRENGWRDEIKVDDASLPNGNGAHRHTQTMDGQSAKSLEYPEERPLPEWQWPARGPTTEQRKVLYGLRKIFSYASMPSDKYASQQGLTIALFPPNIFRWLLTSGSLSAANIERALQDDKRGSTFNRHLGPGQMIKCLVDFDPEMKVLLSVLRAPASLQAEDIWEAVRLLMRSLEYPENLNQDKTKPLANGDTSDALVGQEEEAAAQDLDLAVAALEHGGDIRERALTVALTRLHTFPPSSVVGGMRKMMTRAEIISVLHLLRIELAREGWLSRYIDSEMEVDEESSDQSIRLIGDLLNCSLDSIGAGGWMGGMSHSGHAGDAEELVTALQAEVSATLEGVEEATYLTGLLGEMLRYSQSVAGSARARKSQKDGPGPIIVQAEATDARLLPLGLKAEQEVSRTRIGAGGEIQKRTARDVGRIKSMRVPKYSLERIVI